MKVSLARPASSQLFPWYDSEWLAKYASAEAIVRRVRPTALADFVEAFRVLRTRADFEVTRLEQPFDAETLAAIRRTVSSLRPTNLELHEARRFGRFVVHDHPFFTELQQRVVPLVSEMAGEPVEPRYNFLSLYTAKGVCAVHMDAPESKWTLDLCIDQSAAWPIHFSQVVPWPDPGEDTWGDDWDDRIKRSPAHRFTSHSLLPGQAVVFSGSSQWHYRDPMPQAGGMPFCKLLFFHFIPKGTAELVRPRHWVRLFGIPQLAGLA
jgi:hypothetical protein